ncbi:MAG: hypothetical protein LBW85_10480 [Deltaproteobacteria bacterium]|jgi:hypothetical protein|nr:hypothetical protein [Deltaproteobacteria bacterium]
MTDFEDSGKTADGSAPAGKEEKSRHDQAAKKILAADTDNMPVSEFGFSSFGGAAEYFVVAKSLRNEIPLHLRSKIYIDLLFLLTFKEGVELPPGFNRDAVELLVVEVEEERRARDVAKHVLYAGALLHEYYTSLDIDFRLRMTVIYGPKVSPKKTARTDFGSLVFRPDRIFLAETDIDGLLSRAKGRRESGLKITRLDLYRLFSAPRIGETLDPDLLRLCLGFAADPALSSESLASAVAVEATKLYSRSFTPEAWKKVIRGTRMEEYLDEYDLRIIQEATQKNNAKLALNLLKDGVSRQIIIKNCGVTEQWLQEMEGKLKEGHSSD